MSKIIFSIPINVDVNFLTSVNLGLIYNLQTQNLKCKFFNPISKIENNFFDYTKKILMKFTTIDCIKSLNIEKLDNILKYNDIIDNIIQNFYSSKIKNNIILIEGLIPTCTEQELLFNFNCKIATILNADIIFVTSMLKKNTFEEIKLKINSIFNNFLSKKQLCNSLYIIKKSFHKNNNPFFYCYNLLKKDNIEKKIIKNINSSLLKNNTSFTYIPWGKISTIFKINIIEICQYLNCNIINIINDCKIKSTIFIDNNFINKKCFFEYLIIVSIKNLNFLKYLYKLIINGNLVTAILFTEYKENTFIDNKKIIDDLIHLSIRNKITLLNINLNIWQIYYKLQNFNKNYFPLKDKLLINKIKNYMLKYINKIIFFDNFNKKKHNNYISPYIFKYNIIKQARKLNKCILLPEGNELRIIKAASICANKKIANFILLGKVNEIENLAKINNIILNKRINIVDPDHIRNNYVNFVINMQKYKNIDIHLAQNLLKNNIFLATIMLKLGEVDGLVSGVNHTTADTIRPALQIIKTLPQYSLISSIFFMLLKQGVLIYGDCAVNPNPNAEQLAEIAIQSAKSAILFNIKPKIAMISYATGNSSTGKDVDLVFQATKIVQKQYPNLIIDGPLQYDAAIIEDIGKYKAPNSLVAGQANVIIFPNLNAGNITYKAVQRSSEIISIGPILQGINQPVNDLSRGSSIEDIIYTIVITSIQSSNK
ncbi:phosphate acetyltransferase [Enterobacteriaceae endosymbiont of Plateumaris pusilla]|uniref:phosphate acetyltransferase n=1 Tax=Enterobacteriaceae endosymbiont of Plateumaris pusilla TaxID=2675795 RepID=UPI0014491003|nr:phosphate acetyltransferase [Enterobacteriaceae endosymbiont of Plateumaris pusilla]QJC29377.1 phosphate acetyltransferase [Enterobacteriaceae endosymbiont of Plateumaris pusilla]